MNSINKFKKPIDISSVVIAPRLSIVSNSALLWLLLLLSQTDVTTTTVKDDNRKEVKAN